MGPAERDGLNFEVEITGIGFWTFGRTAFIASHAGDVLDLCQLLRRYVGRLVGRSKHFVC